MLFKPVEMNGLEIETYAILTSCLVLFDCDERIKSIGLLYITILVLSSSSPLKSKTLVFVFYDLFYFPFCSVDLST